MKKVIAISGLPGSGSTTTAKLLSEKTSIEFFTIGQVWKDVSRGKIKEKFYYDDLKKLCDERNLIIPEFSDIDDSHGASSLWNTEFGKSREFNNLLDDLQVQLAKQDEMIIESKLAIHMNPDANLKVWLKAHIDERAKRVAQRDNLQLNEAHRLLKERLEKHKSGWGKIYGLDTLHQEERADIVIDTSSLTPEQVLEKILKEIK